MALLHPSGSLGDQIFAFEVACRAPLTSWLFAAALDFRG